MVGTCYSRADMHDSAAPAEDGTPGKQPPLVLAVDDNPGILRLLRLLLVTEGFEAVTAANGDEALRLSRDRRPAAALVDLNMPGMHGFDLIPRLSEMGIGVLAITASSNPAEQARAEQLGAAGLLRKPFNTPELIRRLHLLLGGERGNSAGG